MGKHCWRRVEGVINSLVIAAAACWFSVAGLGTAAVVPRWAWVSGEKISRFDPVYGTLGVPGPENSPGARSYAATCTDSNGNLWLYGGSLSGSTMDYTAGDLWMYDQQGGNWVWKSGSNTDTVVSIATDPVGVPSSINHPGARVNAQLVAGNDGAVYLFGGNGWWTSGANIPLNDFWKFDPASGMWTLLRAGSSSPVAGNYGVKGTGSGTTRPGGRVNGKMWKDNSGTLWLFGGEGYGNSSFSSGELDDLWKYDPGMDTWTWVNGSELINTPPVAGAQGVSDVDNTPGGLTGESSWVAANGDFWVFGGYSGNTGSAQNMVWRYQSSSNQWTWMAGSFSFEDEDSGAPGVFDPAYTPGDRVNAVAWKAADGKFWIYGGFGYNFDFRGDLWAYDPGINQWAWMGGDNNPDKAAVFGGKGTPDATTDPGSRQSLTGWDDGSGKLWIYSGSAVVASGDQGSSPAYDSIERSNNDLWNFDPLADQWTWMAGEGEPVSGVYGTQGVSLPSNHPGTRSATMTWVGTDGTRWLFGGLGFDADGHYGPLNDLWKYDETSHQWVWVKGSEKIGMGTVAGVKGSPSATAIPGARFDGMTWTDRTGLLWLMGGIVHRPSVGATGDNLQMNDLWNYNPATNKWAYMQGDPYNYGNPSYGNSGEFADSNVPGARNGSLSWVDADGNLCLYGGFGKAEVTVYYQPRPMSDIWKYDIAKGQWAWIGGTNTVGPNGVYGVKGEASASNLPGGRYNVAGGLDTEGNLWVFGGIGYDETHSSKGALNDLWKYDFQTSQWTWVSGEKTIKQYGLYGTMGIADPDNSPGSRSACAGWIVDGTLFIYGGVGYGKSASFEEPLSDLWTCNLSTGAWTWRAGSDEVGQLPAYGNPFQATAATTPGVRFSAGKWLMPDKSVWLFGGAPEDRVPLNDLWHLDMVPVTAGAKDWNLFY